jgi:hypothetical protein
MGSFPYGPHGPETRPYDPTPNPTAPSPIQQIGGADFNSFPTGPYAGAPGATGSGGPFLSFTLSLLMLPFVWMFWICLYPLTALAGAVVGVITSSISARGLQPADGDVAAVSGVIAGFAAIVIVSRIEYKLAQNPMYRNSRHVVRLLLFGVLALPWIQAMVFDVAGGAETRYILSVLTHPAFLIRQLTNPLSLAIVLGVVVGMHFLLWKPGRISEFWHRRLRWIGLK